MDEIIYWAHLASVEGIGGAIFDQLQKRFGSIKRALEAPLDQVMEIPGLDERTAEAICRAHQTVKATETKIKEITGKGIRVLTKMDTDYPSRLREAVNPPPILYQIGKMLPQDQKAVAIIGSRECSEVSAKRAREYAKYLAQHGIAVISGYAYGVDINGHIGAIQGGGRTVIIPGCGVDVFNLDPLKPTGIASQEDLVKQGVVLTEQPPEVDWSARSSLARNRLVAAHASAILVIEARMHSSTLDTVERGKKLGRPIFTQGFGTVSERVMGNEMLRKEGAETISDVHELDKIIDVIKGSSKTGKKEGRVEDLRR